MTGAGFQTLWRLSGQGLSPAGDKNLILARYTNRCHTPVWHEYIVPDAKAKELGQSIGGRLWDLLFTLAVEIRKSRGKTPDILLWKVLFVIQGKAQLVTLKSVCGPGDQAEPVITIMKENED